MSDPPSLLRRRVLGAGALGLSVPVLAACGEDADDPTGDADTSAAPSSESSSSAPKKSESGAADDAATGAPLVAVADVPVGGGVVLADEKVVVTQPSAGDVKCFTAVCTHAQCIVTGVESEEIVCNCHGSRFSIADGSVVQGPATSALAGVDVSVSGRQVVRS